MFINQNITLAISQSITQIKSLVCFGYFNFLDLGSFIEKYGYDIPRISLLLVGIISIGLILVFKFSSLNNELKQNYYEKYFEKEILKKEYHLYFLFVGVTIILTELIFEVFNYRSKQHLLLNCIIGTLIASLYVVFKEIPYLYKNIKKYFIVFYLLLFCYICYNIIDLKENRTSIITFLILIFVSYNLIKPVKYYFYFIGVAFSFILIAFSLRLISVDRSLALLNFSIIVIVINQIRHLIFTNIEDKLQFTNEIVQKGNSLTIACNKKGECLFCSDSIETILGYTPKEVMGMNLWKLTQDPDFIGTKYFEEHDESKVYTRRLRCKNGSYKYIQWKDKKFGEDIMVGVGHDVTEQKNIKNQYQNLVQTATDLIFEIDKHGNFTFINTFSTKVLNYEEKDIIGQNYNQFVRDDFKQTTIEYYENLELNALKSEFPSIVIPLLKKNGEEIWVSQKVIINRNEQNKIIGFSGIARDITDNINEEILKNIQHAKSERYNEIIKNLSTTNFSKFKNIDDLIYFILKKVAEDANLCSTSFWKYKPKQIWCKQIFTRDNNELIDKKAIITKEEFPIYFEAIENKSQIVISDVLSKYETSEFDHDYLDESGVKSLIDSAIHINGNLYGIVCLESKQEKKWDNDDVNFAKTIADILALGIAHQIKLKTQKKLKEKTHLLSALTLCTEKFISTKTDTEMFEKTFEIFGLASKSDRMSYYEKNESTGEYHKKYLWKKESGVEPHSPLTFSTDKMVDILEEINKKSFFYTKISKLNKPSGIKQHMIDNKIQSMLLLPLYEKNEIIGLFGLSNIKKTKNWSKDERYILKTLANNISTFLEKYKTEQKNLESEERVKVIIKTIPGSVYLSKFDCDASKLFLNDEIEKITGYKKEEFLSQNISFLSLIHPDDRDEIISEQIDKLKRGKSIHSSYRLKQKTGNYVWIEEYANIYKNENETDYVGGIYFINDDKKVNTNPTAEKANSIKNPS